MRSTDSTVANLQYSPSFGGQVSNEIARATMVPAVHTMRFNLLVLFKLSRTVNRFQHKLAVSSLIMFHVHTVLALPMTSGGDSSDLAMKSYSLDRISFMTMAAMGAITTAISFINVTIAIAKLCARRRLDVNIPRHPSSCEDGAAAHAALGRPVAEGAPATSSEELSSMAFETFASVNGDTGLRKLKDDRRSQQPASMPLERLIESKHDRISGG